MTSEYYHRILDYLRGLIEGTRWEGHVYAVGGCCRDEIIGCDIKDVDLAIDLAGGGIDFAQWLYEKGLTVREPVTFPTFGTAMLQLCEFPDDEIELVQTRAEKYTDSTRRDPTVVFGPIDEDCRRRDLTINALYYDISREKLLDILGCSVDDIKNRRVRTPNDPDVTFDDDPVRILRAVRLAAKYGWKIDAATFRGMTNNAERLRIVRPERMRAEIDKMLVGSRPALAMDMLRRCGAIAVIMPDLVPLFSMRQSAMHGGTVWEFTMRVLDKVEPTLLLRMAALMHDIGKAACTQKSTDGTPRYAGHERRGKGMINTTLRHFRYDSDFINKVIFLVANHTATKPWGAECKKMTDADLRRLQHKCMAPERLRRLLDLINAINRSYVPEQCWPEQTAIIKRRSEELRREGMALFSYHRQLTAQQIRRATGLPKDANLEPYYDFLLQQAIKNPRTSKDALKAMLKKRLPGGESTR